MREAKRVEPRPSNPPYAGGPEYICEDCETAYWYCAPCPACGGKRTDYYGNWIVRDT